MSKADGHSHGPEDEGGNPDWFRVLDVVVWVSVIAIGIMGAEWLIGKMIRESIAKGASRHLAKVSAPDSPAA